LECWEDLVLSEGTADYLSARVIEVVWGAEAAEEVWATYETRLNQVFHFELDHVAWPDETCMAIDVLGDGLFSPVPYVKGALFYRAVAENVGAPELDRVLGMFVALHRGGTGRMQSLLDLIHTETGFDPEPLATEWLRTEGAPGFGEEPATPSP
jgi:aminopeptidase N